MRAIYAARKGDDMPTYLDQDQARLVLAEMGVELTARQIKRAAEPNAAGQRKLPFFRDPVDGKLKIERESLRRIYFERQAQAENSCGAFQDLSM